MTTRAISACLLFAGLTAGTWSDTPRRNPPLTIGGYRVLAADFHVHSHPLSWSGLGPISTVLEARQQGLDVVALTGHGNVWVGQIGRWFGRTLRAGPIVIPGEEIVPPHGHIIALGIERAISWRLPAAEIVDEIHRQGGVAIAAHPFSSSWPAFAGEAMRKLDGSELVQPVVYMYPAVYRQFREFHARLGRTVIGSSDWHGVGPIGLCRTYVFATGHSAPAVLDALRAGRTVVYDHDGRAYGDPALIQLAARDPRPFTPDPAAPIWISRICGLVGLFGLLIAPYRRSTILERAQ
jgi:hypothetical protein